MLVFNLQSYLNLDLPPPLRGKALLNPEAEDGKSLIRISKKLAQNWEIGAGLTGIPKSCSDQVVGLTLEGARGL